MNPEAVIDGRYRLSRQIGTGGMAEVWLAEDQRLGRMVALKLLRESLSDDEALVGGLEREARMIARLQHPNIVSVFDVGTFEGRHYLVMEYVEGISLRRMVQERGQVPDADIVRFGTQLAAALDYAHRQGIVHNDLKPENILITRDGVAKLTDFGVAEPVTRTLPPEQARELLGTIAYLAPEVIQGAPADQRSDIYSLGLTLYEAAAGRLPWVGASPASVAGQRLATPAPPLRAFAPAAAVGLEAALARSLAINPAERPQTGGDFGRALQAARSAVPPPAPVPVPTAAPRRGEPVASYRPPPPPRSEGSSTTAIIAVVVAVFLAIAAGAVLTYALVMSDDDNDDEAEGTPTPTTEATVEPTEEPTEERPTDEPTPTETPTPTEEPTEEPTDEPTEEPTAEPTVEPTAE